jgi:hypothetical protein
LPGLLDSTRSGFLSPLIAQFLFRGCQRRANAARGTGESCLGDGLHCRQRAEPTSLAQPFSQSPGSILENPACRLFDCLHRVFTLTPVARGGNFLWHSLFPRTFVPRNLPVRKHGALRCPDFPFRHHCRSQHQADRSCAPFQTARHRVFVVPWARSRVIFGLTLAKYPSA